MTTSTRRLRKAVLPVAGLGTRVLPGTKTTPKELLNVVDRPILSYIVEEAREAGIEHIVFVTGRSKGAIEDYFDHQIELEAQLLAKGKTDILEMMNAELASAGEMSFTRQMQPLGLGHSGAVAAPAPGLCGRQRGAAALRGGAVVHLDV